MESLIPLFKFHMYCLEEHNWMFNMNKESPPVQNSKHGNLYYHVPSSFLASVTKRLPCKQKAPRNRYSITGQCSDAVTNPIHYRRDI